MTGTPPTHQLDVRTADGSVRCYVTGSLDAPAIVSHHGTPSTGIGQAAAFVLAGVPDVCHVAFDRPGYAGSTRMEGRSVADVADVVRSILDELGVDRAATFGHSGGGPHALATAALLPERVTRAAVAASMAPVGRPNFDYFAAQVPLMQEEMHAALAGPQASRDYLRRLTAANPDSPFGAVLTDGDLRVIAEAQPLAESLTRTLGAQEASTRLEDGYVDDIQALAGNWGFELESITIPVQLLQGTDDLMVAPAHAKWLQDQIPRASLRVLPGEGHMLQPFHADAFAWLTAS